MDHNQLSNHNNSTNTYATNYYTTSTSQDASNNTTDSYDLASLHQEQQQDQWSNEQLQALPLPNNHPQQLPQQYNQWVTNTDPFNRIGYACEYFTFCLNIYYFLRCRCERGAVFNFVSCCRLSGSKMGTCGSLWTSDSVKWV